MEAGVLETVGQVAGIGGLALGVFLLLFRDLIRKSIFPKLPAAEAYRLLRLITGAVWSVALVGIAAWVYVETQPPAAPTSSVQQETHGDNSPAISDVEGGVRIITPSPPDRGKE